MIGNPPADMLTVETGAKLISSHEIGDVLERFNWDVGVAVPTIF